MDKERRKNIVIPVVLLLGIFIGGAIVLRTQGIGAQVLTEGKKVLFPIASEPDADPDGDGLKNWQEETYKTDPRNPDTDGDGYLDGEEVASGYNPTIPAPNDALEGTDTDAPRQAPKNLTLHLAQILTQKISSGEIEPTQASSLAEAANDLGLPYNEDIINEALVQIGLRAKEYFALPRLEKNLISEDISSNAQALMHIVQLNDLLRKQTEEIINLRLGETNAMKVIERSISSKNIEGVLAYSIIYKKTAGEINFLQPPPALKEWNDQFAFSFSILAKIFDAIAHFQEDPALAAAALESYPSTIEQISLLLEMVSSHSQ